MATEEEYLELIKTTSKRLQLDVSDEHFDTNKSYYWNNKGQLKTVIEKGLPDDKLKVIFQGHINKLSKGNQVKQEDNKNDEILVYPPVKIMKTPKYSVYCY